MIVIITRVPPCDGGKVIAKIDQRVTTNRAPVGASLRQQRAWAFVELLSEGGTAGTKVQAEVVVHVNEDGNAFPDGTPLTDNAVTELLSDGFVSLLIHDNQRHPIDASPRRRTPTRRQQRVIDARQPTCAHPGCTATALLQYDHIQPYNKGGPTVLANLQPLCGPHNRAKERS